MDLTDKIISLCKRRGFVYPGSEIYGGWLIAGITVRWARNSKTTSRNFGGIFVRRRDDMFGIDAALIMNRRVWEASGHVKNFSDPLSDCKNVKIAFVPIN